MTQEQEQELTLTTEQWTKVLKIQDDMVDTIKGNVKATVRTACELMDNEGIPKEKICYLVCQRHADLGYSEDYLRTFVPVEYKNQAQRNVALIKHHDGIDNLSQHETTTKTLEVNSERDIEVHENPISTSAPKKIGSLTQKYKSELDKLRIENILFRNRSGITFVYECIKDETPEPELGKKIKEYFLKNKWYLKWLKEDKKYEASLNVEGKTREEAYLDNQNKMVEEQDQKEKRKAAKAEKKAAEKSKPVEPKDISKNLLKCTEQKSNKPYSEEIKTHIIKMTKGVLTKKEVHDALDTPEERLSRKKIK